MGKVSKLYPKNAAVDPDVVLERSNGVFESVVIIGFNKDGDMEARASINITHSEILWILESFKRDLIDGVYGDD